MPIFLKGNHQLESRMQENCQSGSEGGAKTKFVPTPISAQALAWVNIKEVWPCRGRRDALFTEVNVTRNSTMFLVRANRLT